jgi:hypothetical protein
MYQEQPKLLDLAPGCTESLVMPTILGGLHGIRVAGTASL